MVAAWLVLIMQAQSPITHRMAALVLRSCPTDLRIYAVNAGELRIERFSVCVHEEDHHGLRFALFRPRTFGIERFVIHSCYKNDYSDVLFFATEIIGTAKKTGRDNWCKSYRDKAAPLFEKQ
jgi:hypothetical protein